MPSGSGERALYPSAASWLVILDALADAFPGVEIALIGKRRRDRRTSTSFATDELAELLAHRARPLDCFDVPLAEQLAFVEACDLFLAPHTGFGMAALAVGTPWLALSGGRWFKYFFNRVPFRSIIPDRIVDAARELLGGSLTYEQSLRDYFPALLAAHGGDAGAIWSIDGVHFAYV